MANRNAIHRETVDGVVHLSTVYRGVEYLARADGAGWEVMSHRQALGPHHTGMVRRFASTDALATGLRAFAALAETEPSPQRTAPAAAHIQQVIRRLKTQHQTLGTAANLQVFARKKLGPALLDHIHEAEALDIPPSQAAARQACQDAITDAMALIGRWQLVRMLLPPGSVRA